MKRPRTDWEADVVTADGGTVHVRPIRSDDGLLIEAFHGRQSRESIYFRFFTARPRLSAAEIRHLTHVDQRDRVALVALVDDTLVGVGRYDRLRGDDQHGLDEAEVAFFVDDEHHGRGLATILLEYLATAAEEVGIQTFVAHVLPDNRKMLGVFRQAGFEVASRFADGVIEVRFDIEPTEASLAAVEARALRSEARSVARLLRPRTVAVIGAGRQPGTIGHEVFRQLLAHDFAGAVYPVNREAQVVASVRAWPSVVDVAVQVDLAVVAVPAEEVLDVVDECARAGVGALVVVSVGFAEAGPDGVAREQALLER
ncbi:MAG: GNAT family N-acetyltransferase, partial [Acidimicrobiales bacterium]